MEYAVTMLVFNVARRPRSTRSSGFSTSCRSTPTGSGAVSPDPRLEHGGLLHDEHELAGLRGRVDDVALHPDGGARPPQLPLGRDRHRDRGRASIRGIARAEAKTHRQLLGRLTRAIALGPPAVLARRRALPDLAGRRPELLGRTSTVTTLEGATQTIPHGPGRLAGGDQGARDERRRLLQRELRPPVREPDARYEPPRDAPHLRDPGGPDLHARPMTGQPRHGWAVFGAMALLFLAGAGVAAWAEQRGQPDPSAPLGVDRRGRRQHGGQGGPLRHRRLRALRHDHDGRLLRRRQLHARLLHAARRPRAARQHRSARSSSAASARASTACSSSSSSRSSSPA